MFTQVQNLPPGPVLLENIGKLYCDFNNPALEDAWMVMRGGQVEDLGQGEAPEGEFADRLDLKDLTIVPAPIDAHTHLLFAGDRSEEFGARFSGGDSYGERLEKGGGIRATVRAVEACSDDHLVAITLDRILQSVAFGVCALEIKSGYGLSIEGERRLMGVLDQIRAQSPIPVFPTLLMHVPIPDLSPGALLEQARLELLPLAEELGFGVDVFVEEGAFSVDDARPFLEDAAQRNLPIHLHAEQLSASGAGRLAAELGAVSAEHLEFIDAEGCAALARAGTVANLLPGAWLQLGGGAVPPIQTMREAGVKMAVATDWNPGSSYLGDPLLAASLAVTCWGLSPREAWAGITQEAACALGQPDLGRLDIGGRGRPWILAEPGPEALLQRMALPRRGGQLVQAPA